MKIASRRVFVAAMCVLAFCASSCAVYAQTRESQVSAEWKALGWTLPKSFSPDQIALFAGLNAARGTWSFEATSGDGDTDTALTGNLMITGSSQGGMASAWNLIWSWPAEDPRHAIVENIVAMPEFKNQQFGLMLVRFGPMNYSDAQLKKIPKAQPTVFQGRWNAEKKKINWIRRGLPGIQGNNAVTKEELPATSFEMVVADNGKISIQNSENLPSGQISTAGAKIRTGEAPQEQEKPEYLTGIHRFQKASEISDPRIMQYLPADATDVRLISDRNGHMAHYRISAEAFDMFLAGVWERYRKERAAEPKRWVDYSEESISAALMGSPVGRYEPRVRSTEIVFDKPIVWEPLENATSYEGPRRRSAAGATYYFDRKTGIACHDAGYW